MMCEDREQGGSRVRPFFPSRDRKNMCAAVRDIASGGSKMRGLARSGSFWFRNVRMSCAGVREMFRGHGAIVSSVLNIFRFRTVWKICADRGESVCGAEAKARSSYLSNLRMDEQGYRQQKKMHDILREDGAYVCVVRDSKKRGRDPKSDCVRDSFIV